MQEFLLNNTVNCNLMSLTGYRTLELLKMLIESPKSTDEINREFLNNQYIKETFSKDTLRIYINSLRLIGCDISRADRSTDNRYVLYSHPFDLSLSNGRVKALSRLYRSIYSKIDLVEVVNLEKLFKKIADTVLCEESKDALLNLSMLKNIDEKILDELIVHCRKKNQIVFVHKSAKSGFKKIEIIAEKLFFKSEKLYILGYSLTHGEHSFYRVDRIQKVAAVNLVKENVLSADFKVVYEISNCKDFHLDTNERLVSQSESGVVVEVTSNNKFLLVQKFLNMANLCKILEPTSFRNEFVEKLKLMKANYN